MRTYPRRHITETHVVKHSKVKKGVALRITDVKQKSVFLCHSPENYIAKFKEFTEKGIEFTFSHSLEAVEKMILCTN